MSRLRAGERPSTTLRMPFAAMAAVRDNRVPA